MKVLQAICLLLAWIFSPSNAQLPIVGNQPYFRGIISGIPLSNSNGEFQPFPGDTERPLVTISDGTLRGFTMRTINNRKISAFQSIPFAQPPEGPLRFKEPLKNSPWSGILNALPQSPQCIQLDLMRGMQVHGTENCLYLNVYTPQAQNHSLLPVMVWIHGGGFFFGSGGIYGPKYLLDQNIVLVTFNYRLGPFGFLSTGNSASAGNQALKDQVLALQWIQENISQFGGDPNSVTLFGESVGASAVGLHLVSPRSRGLFHRAIQQSSSSLCYWANIPNATEVALKIGTAFKCPKDSYGMVECLQKIPAVLLAPIQLIFIEWFIYPLVVFGPTVEHQHEQAFLTKTPEQYYENREASDVTLVSGINRNELVWLVSAMIHDVVHVNDINTQWERVGPIMLALDYNSTQVNGERARKIWDFYMGPEKLSWRTRHRFAELFSDRFINECSLEQMRYHSQYTRGDVYAYHLTYKGRFSNVQQFGGKPEDWGRQLYTFI